MSDDEIIELYFARDERALAQTERKYGPYCFSLANNILASPEDAEETVSDTYLKAWQTIPPKRPGVLRMYLAKITRNLALSRWRGLTARKRGGGQIELALDELHECLPGGKSEEELIENRVLTEALNRFLGSLPEQTRKIFMLRYWYLCSVRKIAGSLGLSESGVKMSLLRSRKQLKAMLQKEGISL